jgi:hypothetical protein
VFTGKGQMGDAQPLGCSSCGDLHAPVRSFLRLSRCAREMRLLFALSRFAARVRTSLARTGTRSVTKTQWDGEAPAVTDETSRPGERDERRRGPHPCRTATRSWCRRLLDTDRGSLYESIRRNLCCRPR